MASIKFKHFISVLDWIGRAQVIAWIFGSAAVTALIAAMERSLSPVKGLWLCSVVCSGVLLMWGGIRLAFEKGWIKSETAPAIKEQIPSAFSNADTRPIIAFTADRQGFYLNHVGGYAAHF